MKLVIITGGSTAHHHGGKLLPTVLIVRTSQPLSTHDARCAKCHTVFALLAEAEHL